MNKQKRVAAIHDISCFGKCSLTVALPILSAMGLETTVLPTAILSTHTGGFEGYTYRDLTEDVLPIVRHWNSLHIPFDSLYTGFLGSAEQIQLIEQTIDLLRGENTLVLVDPVMADNGQLYGLFPPSFPQKMRGLVAKADVIVPNLTEATLLLGEDYVEGPYTKEYIEGLLQRLGTLGAPRVVLTGVFFDEVQLGAATYDARTGEIAYAFAERIPGYYHGTGDVFGSALLGALLHDFPLPACARVAVQYTAGSIARTKEAGTDLRFGVNFEEGIPALIEMVCK